MLSVDKRNWILLSSVASCGKEELECLAIVASLKHLSTLYKYSKEVTVVTDHKPCLALENGSHLNKHLLRFALVLQQFNVFLEYRPGKLHANADGMSRQAWPSAEVESAQVFSSDLSPGQILAGGRCGRKSREKDREEDRQDKERER